MNDNKDSKSENISYKLKRLKFIEAILMIMLFAMLIAIIFLLNVS